MIPAAPPKNYPPSSAKPNPPPKEPNTIPASFAYTFGDAEQRVRLVRGRSGSNLTAIEHEYDPIRLWVSAEGDFPGYSFHQSDDPAGNPVRQDNNSFELTNTFNNLNQNATSWRCGGATILGTMNLTNGAVTVSGLPASTRTNNFGVIFMATNLLLFTGTNAYMAAFADVFSRSATSVGSVVATDRGYGYDANGKMTNDGDRLRCVRTVRQTNPLMTCACKELSGTLGGACGIGGILAMHSADSTYFHCNGNGNVIALTTTNGAVNGRDRSRRVVACPSRPRIQLYAE